MYVVFRKVYFIYRFWLVLENLVLQTYFAFRERQLHLFTNRSRYNFSVQALAVTTEMITVNFPLATPNVTERERLKKRRTLLTCS